MLHRGLPVESPSKTDPEVGSWSTTEELLAQLIEEVSVMTADHRRKEPRTVPRPYANKPTPPPKPGITEGADGAMRAVGPAAIVLAAAKAQVTSGG